MSERRSVEEIRREAEGGDGLEANPLRPGYGPPGNFPGLAGRSVSPLVDPYEAAEEARRAAAADPSSPVNPEYAAARARVAALVGNVMSEVSAEVVRQGQVHPAGYPRGRNGLRLGLAALEDELVEARDAWREGRCKCPDPDCDHGSWSALRDELVQVAGVACRMLVELS